ncbi:MAG: hypothetical protein GY732_11795 [Gammaproteobacteria bacterium]|nr:hypothetical protein [Gammaproteobacteria bacterium]
MFGNGDLRDSGRVQRQVDVAGPWPAVLGPLTLSGCRGDLAAGEVDIVAALSATARRRTRAADPRCATELEDSPPGREKNHCAASLILDA